MFKNINSKRVIVVGLARSGVGAANLLVRLGAIVTIMDELGYKELENYVDQLDSSVDIKLGQFRDELFDKADFIVVSPGVPMQQPSIKRAQQKGIKVIGELELAYEVIEEFHKICSLGFLAITGTNGKSTTTTMLNEILRNGGFNTVLGGNIGKALTEEISKLVRSFDKPREFVRPDYIVTEVSSFQLESIDRFKPKVAAILNITPDHLDRHGTMQNYIDAKCRIFENQDKMNFLILNADDPSTQDVASMVGTNGPDILYFSRKYDADAFTNGKLRGAFYKDGAISFKLPELEVLCPELVGHQMPVINAADLKVTGVHNIENTMAAALMALVCGCSMTNIWNTLKDFKGLEHRVEFVEEINGVNYYNDSKGTNIWAVIKSLESFDRPVILIAGGRDKAGDFSALRQSVKNKVKAAILIGEARYKLNNSLQDITSVYMEQDMQSAVVSAKGIANPGDVVLLSPACASFDMFKDFEERGRVFKQAVLSLSDASQKH
ncbi:MAG: UDP-N-acetylmuramoyl-L-alanine--D-glutamate ligase [Nitrospirae bacterium]|nr:UDP-N-acetylmuramoyl-L-alanine--D-glutamate ligase [Nitrospirota bacterium]